MPLRDKFIDLQRFIYKSKENNCFAIDYEQRSKYSEKLMYYYMGANIASLDVKRLPFYKRRRGSTYVARASKLGQQILNLLRHAGQSRVLGWYEEYYLIIEKSPIMNLTYNAFSAAASLDGEQVAGMGFVEPVLYSEYTFKTACGKRTDEVIERLNNFVLKLKEKLTNSELREEIKNFYRNSKERYFQLMQVALQAWDIRCKNVLIRIDWGFFKKNPPMPPRFKTEAEINQDFSKVDAIRKLMIKRLKNMFGNDISFYAWKIECGYDKGLHIHWLIALNGSKYKNTWFNTEAIVNDWNQHVCGEDSYACNVSGFCESDSKYLRNIDHRDEDLPNILSTYAKYITKLDITMKLRAPDGFRTFGCSKLRKLRTSKPGPMRLVSSRFNSGVKND